MKKTKHLEKRLEIRLSPTDLVFLQRMAKDKRESVSEVVRDIIRLAKTLEEEDKKNKKEAVETLFKLNAPVAEWEQMKKEIMDGSLGE